MKKPAQAQTKSAHAPGSLRTQDPVQTPCPPGADAVRALSSALADAASALASVGDRSDEDARSLSPPGRRQAQALERSVSVRGRRPGLEGFSAATLARMRNNVESFESPQTRAGAKRAAVGRKPAPFVRKPAAYVSSKRFALVRKPASALGRSHRHDLRSSGREPSAVRKTGPKTVPFDKLSKSGQKHRRKAWAKVRCVLVVTGWGRCGSMNFACNLSAQGHAVTHEVDS